MGFRSRALALVAALLAVTVATAADLAVVFSKGEIAIIRDYYAQPHENAGKGQQKKQTSKPLPPGIAKNLTRGKPLPPGIAKQRLPDDLIQRLPPVRAGYERVIVDGRLLLVAVATQVIADVLSDAVFN
jgi:Ni/Co efflux regulator RcnB